jgi:hypothetical protein
MTESANGPDARRRLISGSATAPTTTNARPRLAYVVVTVGDVVAADHPDVAR